MKEPQLPLTSVPDDPYANKQLDFTDILDFVLLE